jgi:hypothetical protein
LDKRINTLKKSNARKCMWKGIHWAGV